MSVSLSVELRVLTVPGPAPHLALHLQPPLPALGLLVHLGRAQTDVGRQDEAPGGHQEDGEQGGDVGEEEAGQEVALDTQEVEHQDISHQDQGAAQ